jgi:hypothetical protein
MILIQVACRVSCNDTLVEGPTLRRQNSIERKEELVRSLPIEELLKVDASGETFLDAMIRGYLPHIAKLLLNRIEAETTPENFKKYYITGKGSAYALKATYMLSHNYSPNLGDLPRFLDEKYQDASIKQMETNRQKSLKVAPKTVAPKTEARSANQRKMLEKLLEDGLSFNYAYEIAYSGGKRSKTYKKKSKNRKTRKT